MGHHVIRPVQRDCICPTRPPVAHTPGCEDAFRNKFFAARQSERDRFYGLRVESRPSVQGAP
jgi:hypothetical protein